MKFLLFISAITCFTLTYGSVVELTDSNFYSRIEDFDIALVKFYAPWCGHCKRMAPEFEKASIKLKTNDPPVTLVKVDCTIEKKVCEDHKVQGFPTLKIFRKGVISSDYEGPRDADGIIKYMRGQSGPSSRELKSIAEYEKFLADEDHSVIGFFETESKLKDSFLKVADTERDRFRFAHTSDKTLIQKLGYNDDIVVFTPKKLQNKFESNEHKYDGNYDTDKIKAFLIHESTGLAGIRTQGNLFQFTRRPLFNVYYNVDYVKDPKGSHYWRNRVLKVAQDFKRKAYFSISAKEEFGDEIESFGLGERKESDKPIVGALTKDGKYPMETEFSVENLKKFVESVLEGKVEPYMKSEPVPETQGNLKVAVGKNFKELITDADKDVLIEFYAPWCGHCKNLAPTYEELADKLADEDVIIAKMDAVANDVPPMFEVKGFPTIYWLPKDTKVPVPYNSGRELKDFIKFIASKSTDGLKGYDKTGKEKKSEL